MKWNKDYDPDLVISRINEVRKTPEGGGVSFSDHNDEGWQSLLASMVILPKTISPSAKELIVRNTIIGVNLCSPFTKQAFEDEIKCQRDLYWKKPNVDYKVIFEFPRFIDLKRKSMKLGETTMNFRPSTKTPIFKTILQERQELEKTHIDQLQFKRKEVGKTQIIIATIKARSAAEAQENATKNFQMLLGLLNYLKNRPKLSRLSFGQIKQINEFVYLPFTTVHDARGKLAYNGYWYQNWVSTRTWSAERLRKESDKINKLLPIYLKDISALEWKESAHDVLAKYYQAFSEPELEVSFLEIWRVLEKFGGSRECSYDGLIQRCSNMFEDKALYLQFGRHLTERRNAITHGNHFDGSDREVVAYQLMTLMHPLLGFYLRNPFKLKSLKDLWAFADLKMDASHLKQEIHVREKALKFIK